MYRSFVYKVVYITFLNKCRIGSLNKMCTYSFSVSKQGPEGQSSDEEVTFNQAPMLSSQNSTSTGGN